ncbi:MAG: hypothetical protein LBT44_01615 [Clostridiales bacterium]|jgi:hypothetical protein|nr:hypothetical protein [Clostridiales bacterium]
MDTNDSAVREGHIDWHSAFFDAIQMELAQDRDKLQFEREHPLNVEPLRPDVLIIKKPPNAALHQKFAEIFRGHNIFEFKSPEDSLSVSDYMKTFSYPCVYQQEANISYTDVTLTMVRDSHPRELLKYLLTELKREVEEKSPGIFIVKGEMFPMQVIVSSRLPEKENIWLKNLNKGKLDIQTLQKMRTLKRGVGKDINMGAYFSVIFAAKADLLKEVERMGRASLAEVIEDMGLRQEWEDQGFNKGIDSTLYIIKRLKENVSPENIAVEFNLPVEKIIKIKSSL